jgi:hypothetical protein
MGTFADTANFNYHLSFAGQGKQTSVFHLQQTNGSFPFPFPELMKNDNFHLFAANGKLYKYIYIYILVCCHFVKKTIKRKKENQAIFLNSFTVWRLLIFQM